MFMWLRSGRSEPVSVAGSVFPMRGCAPIRNAGDVYSLMVSDQLVPKTNQPTKGLTSGGDLRQAQVDVPSSV